ncbi:MAG: sulfite exporter TauE/SafE family protein [Firmicutes bacterium HGW-Firmicutes-14]|nr:MAG: sulfite exporter TauE/SafE family protein [Firmicutes bacterium HGW-Firmicutes-14]
MKHFNLLFLIIIGIITGFINGLLGIGGGTILIPSMVFLLGVAQHQAHGTSLAVIMPTTIASCIIYGLNKDLDFRVALQVVTGGIAGGYLGARLMNRISAGRLRQFFGVFMFLAGIRMFF